MQIKHQTTTCTGNGVVENLDPSPTVRSEPQVVEYIRELTAELERVALAANCGSLAYLLAIANLEARALAGRGG